MYICISTQTYLQAYIYYIHTESCFIDTATVSIPCETEVRCKTLADHLIGIWYQLRQFLRPHIRNTKAANTKNAVHRNTCSLQCSAIALENMPEFIAV